MKEKMSRRKFIEIAGAALLSFLRIGCISSSRRKQPKTKIVNGTVVDVDEDYILVEVSSIYLISPGNM